jgi:hypothetical protein
MTSRERIVVAPEGVDQPCRVRQQLMHGDVTLVVGHRAKEVAYRIGHSELPHHLELQDRRSSELLSHRHDVVDRVASSGDLGLAISPADAFTVLDLAAADGKNLTAGPLGPSIVEKPLDRLINKLGRRRHRRILGGWVDAVIVYTRSER